MSGYFAENSMAVRVMSTRIVGITYGERALVIGACNPLLYVGTAEHTAHRTSPYTRLSLTGRMFEAVFLGSRDEADKALDFTRKRHATVVGALPEDAGTHPAGSPYSAHDPHLMFMTMAFAFDSAETMYDLLVRRMTDAERADLWLDFVTWATLFGMPRDAAPSTYHEFRSYFDAYLASDELHLTDEAQLVGTYLAGAEAPRYPLPSDLTARTLGLLVQGSLPRRIRDLYGLRWTFADAAAFRATVEGSRALHRRPLPFTPPLLRPMLRGASTPSYNVLAAGERRNLRRGLSSMPGVAG
ncbi:oxygenase MpaB family protein [Antrihabitans cavernicola]|uniref:DUF2236 domain-containing protein n=1 Tax=Antrihabitans cavernicola TaxID=2495913 RepID=A0A5A7SBK4_9NOCA|nr:oxygenase MpaB family protein [Spelaeibacter cavernicola]KAA0022699.1 DUF2236 domain-containing protein [Spelaeibacter cavernicola]